MRPQDPNAPPSPYTAMLAALATRYGTEVADFARETYRQANNVRYQYDEARKAERLAARRAAHTAKRARLDTEH